jgi:hypothetical protein
MNLRRISAIVLLILFVLLLLDIFVFRFLFQEAIAVYVILLVCYIFFGKRLGTGPKSGSGGDAGANDGGKGLR